MIEAGSLDRAALRRLLRRKRRALSPSEQRRAARGLYRQIAQHPAFRRARSIAAYLPNDGEIDPRLLIREAQRRGKAVYLPVLSPWPRTHMLFQRIHPAEPLISNRFGIREPRPNRARQQSIRTLSMILLPLVGFDASGGRLGMGGGFYDRSLAFLTRPARRQGTPRLVGVAHELQRVDRLPVAPWDVPLQAVVTNLRWY